MRELKFPASFVSAIRRFEATWAAAETEGASAAAIRGVYAATEAAQRFYRNRRYEDAIREFKRAQSSIYRLLNPKHSLDQHIADDRLMLSWKNNRRASRGDVIAVGGEHPEGCRAHGRSATAVSGVAPSADLEPQGMDPVIHTRVPQSAELIAAGNGPQAAEVLANFGHTSQTQNAGWLIHGTIPK
jgi:hypothetical protein